MTLKERFCGKLVIDGEGTEEIIRRLPNIPEENWIETPEKEISVSWRNNFDRMEQIAQAWKEIYPYVDYAYINANKITEYPNKPYLVWWASDMHIGGVDTEHKKLRKDIDLIENTPNCGLVTLGDDIDYGVLPRFEVRFLQTAPPYVQAFTMRDLMEEFNGRNPRKRQLILASVIGNHTHTMMEVSGILFENFYSESKAPIMPGMGSIDLEIGNETYMVGLAHKFFGTSKLNVTLAPKRLMEFAYPEADVLVVGHQHKTAHEFFNRGGKQRLAVRPGTYRCGEGLFEKARGWGGGELGGSSTIFYPDKHQMEHYDNLEMAISRMESLLA